MKTLPAALLLSAVLATGCAPSLSPLYRDYEVPASDTSRTSDVTDGLREAGWTVVQGETPNTIATEERTISQWGLYKVVVSLEVVPLGERYVRVLFHPYRKYFTGSRSKIPFLKSSLRSAMLDDLNDAFEAEGLQAIGTPMQRDRKATAR